MVVLRDLLGLHLESYNQLLILVLLIFILLLQLGIFISFVTLLKMMKETSKRYLELYELDLQCKYNVPVTEVEDELDDFISNVFSRYIYINKYGGKGLISEAEETEMYGEVVNNVLSQMSNVLLNKVLMVYNKNNINEIITQKVIILVSTYCLKNNSPIEEKNK